MSTPERDLARYERWVDEDDALRREVSRLEESMREALTAMHDFSLIYRDKWGRTIHENYTRADVVSEMTLLDEAAFNAAIQSLAYTNWNEGVRRLLALKSQAVERLIAYAELERAAQYTDEDDHAYRYYHDAI